jgi:hypothetical protein
MNRSTTCFKSRLDRVAAQPGFNRWSYYHKARKLKRQMDRRWWQQPTDQDFDKADTLTERYNHYIDLCWDRNSTSTYAADAASDRKAYRNNHRYRTWAKKHKFFVGKIIKLTKELECYSWIAGDYGAGEKLRVIEVIPGSGNGFGFPHIRVERARDGLRLTSPVGPGDERETRVYDAAWFVVPKKGLYPQLSAGEERVRLSEEF